MEDFLSRTKMLIGEDAVARLSTAHVALFGLGGVGGYALEALVRAGVGTITVVDDDTVSPSNLNRQILATLDSIGKDKTEVALKRATSISPTVKIIPKKIFFTPQVSNEFDFSCYDYVIDAIDTVTAKIELAVRCHEKGVKLISCMGTGNKLDPTAFEVSDISKTSVCPLCRVMRKELKSRGITSLKVVYSKEEPIKPNLTENGKQIPSSISFVPSVAGLIIAGEVIKDLIK